MRRSSRSGVSLIVAIALVALARVSPAHGAVSGAQGNASSIIPIKVHLQAQVQPGAMQSVTVTTTPGASITMTVSYSGGGGFTTNGSADGQGVWSDSWQVPTNPSGTAVVRFAVTVGGLTRHFTKRFALAAAPSLNGGSAISVQGPTTNLYNTHFQETVTGKASGGADYVISGEQLDPVGGCASTYAGESAKSPLNWSGAWPKGGNGSVSGTFSLVARFDAVNLGTHGICTYLINKATNTTYAYAQRWWTNLYGWPVAGSGTISIQGPTQNAYHTPFNQTVSGTANGGANYVISVEQLNQVFGRCQTSYLNEAGISNFSQWPTGTGSVSGHFSFVAKFYAAHLGTRGICSYLINQKTKQTYAHASLWWTNS